MSEMDSVTATFTEKETQTQKKRAVEEREGNDMREGARLNLAYHRAQWHDKAFRLPSI